LQCRYDARCDDLYGIVIISRVVPMGLCYTAEFRLLDAISSILISTPITLLSSLLRRNSTVKGLIYSVCSHFLVPWLFLAPFGTVLDMFASSYSSH
jgi:hypothetical protein